MFSFEGVEETEMLENDFVASRTLEFKKNKHHFFQQGSFPGSRPTMLRPCISTSPGFGSPGPLPSRRPFGSSALHQARPGRSGLDHGWQVAGK